MRVAHRVLVTDGDERAALAVTRALGQHHVEVIVGSETERSLAAARNIVPGLSPILRRTRVHRHMWSVCSIPCVVKCGSGVSDIRYRHARHRSEKD